ncbi:hypothetical protein KJ780_03810 [Candidatus Micrarchaeota archaeon]|nr:hypothetical protein [Candidatus Micrarchaeota archaeon]
MKTKSLRILVKTRNACKFLFKFKELFNGDILYSFGALDGRPRSLLFGETCHVIESGDRYYKYADATIISETVDHFSLHAAGYHVITSPSTKTKKSAHWGMIIQPKMQTPFEWRNFGIILPAAFERFPNFTKPFDPTRDTQIDITALKFDMLYFELGIIGRKLEKDKPGFFGVPSGMVNTTATSVEQCFVDALDWFLLPLTSYTMLVVLKAVPPGSPPPRTVFVRWEHGDPAKAHIAYLE